MKRGDCGEMGDARPMVTESIHLKIASSNQPRPVGGGRSDELANGQRSRDHEAKQPDKRRRFTRVHELS
jgi:hypothetical protein